jgi:predicted O-linked N-acetylglucosamine transferase (SPINDLY family)
VPAEKIPFDLMETWGQVLERAPDSMLMLHPFASAALSSPETNVQLAAWDRALSKYGVSDDRLLVLEPPQSSDAILQNFSVADAYLDSVPVADVYGVANALGTGTPVVTLESDLPASRIISMLLRESGAPRGSKSIEDYVLSAVKLQRKSSTKKSPQMAKIPSLDPAAFGRALMTKLEELLKS